MTTTYAPILLFVYNRPQHVCNVVQSLLQNALAAESDIFIYSDAPKSETDGKNVAEVRKYIRTIKGFKTVTLIKRTENWGLARSIIDGVTTQVNRFGRVIVMEDDLIAAPYFLQFMKDIFRAAISRKTLPCPIPFSSNGQAVGDGPPGTGLGNCSIRTARSFSGNWKSAISPAGSTSTTLTVIHECCAGKLKEKITHGPSVGTPAYSWQTYFH